MAYVPLDRVVFTFLTPKHSLRDERTARDVCRSFSIMLAFFSAFFGKTKKQKRIASIFCHFSWLWSIFQRSEGCFQSWKPQSMSSKIALSSTTFKPVWWHNTTSDKRSQLLTVYWNVNVLYELEVEQNCASLGCVYPAHGSASNMTV